MEKGKNAKTIKKKRKRKVSIFTIFLWLFLITTMSTITIGSLTKKNAIEVTDNSWNINLVMYDRSSDTPDQSITDFTWNATNKAETKQLVMQINYACTTGKEYQPGEIVVEIPGIAKDSFSEYWRNPTGYGDETYNEWLENNIVVAADKENISNKQYDWSYQYNEEKNVYIFTNNMTIAENEHFEGMIQIVYNLFPKFRIKTDLEFQAKIKENIESDEIIAMESNICNFHYTSNKENYTLKIDSLVAPKIDYTPIEDILDNYYWVRYRFKVLSNNDGIVQAYGESNKLGNSSVKCIREELPEGCVLYDKNLNKIEPQEGNTYYYLNGENYSIDDYYVGYPKDKYQEGDSVTNTAELWGRYEDEEEMQKITENDGTVSLVEFDFEYKGDLYGISKFISSTDRHYLNAIKSEEGEKFLWWCNITAFYTNSLMDVEIGDDLLYITRENGEVTKLEESEYHFTEIHIPVFYTYNKYSGEAGDPLIGYEWDLQVRYIGTDEYISYQTGITGEKSQSIKFENNDIVGIKLVIRNLDKTLYHGSTIGDAIIVKNNIHTQNCVAGGKIFNFAYLQVYHKDDEGNRTLVNEPTLDSYSTESTRLKVAEYDQATYGTYMQRASNNADITEGYFKLGVEKIGYSLQNNVEEEKYTYEYALRNYLRLLYYEVNEDVVIKTYDILPEGMYLSNNQENIINSIEIYDKYNAYKNLKLKDGTTFASQNDFINYIKENTEVEIDYNYKDSGRTKISIITDLKEIDWSYYLVN